MNIDERLMLAKDLVTQLEAGNEAEADQISVMLVGDTENNLYQEVGRLTRELHDALNNFMRDPRIPELAEIEIPDAKERLSYVLTMTERSANTTLAAVEEGIPISDELGNSAAKIYQEWELFKERKLTVEDFRALSTELTDFLANTKQQTADIHGKLTDVLMAQEFQDLTGQIIRKVITLVQDVEDKLVELVRITGAQLPESTKQHSAEILEGPVVPGVDQGDVVNSQDDVDDLLSSLGF